MTTVNNNFMIRRSYRILKHVSVVVLTLFMFISFAQADEANPTDQKNAIFQKALAAHRNKQYAKAIEYYSQYITLDPSNPYMYYNRGVVYLQTTNCTAAVSDFQQVISLKPSFKMAYYETAICYGDYLKDYNKALFFFDKTLKLDPKYVLALRNKAVTLFKLKRYNDSIDVFNQILDINTVYKQSYVAIAVNYFRLNQLDMTKIYVKKALKAGIPYNSIPRQILDAIK